MMLTGCGSFLKNRFFVLRTRFPYLFIREFGDRHLPEQFVWRLEMTYHFEKRGTQNNLKFPRVNHLMILYSLIYARGAAIRHIFKLVSAMLLVCHLKSLTVQFFNQLHRRNYNRVQKCFGKHLLTYLL